MAGKPLKYYRLWCGRKRYTHWLADKKDVWRAALRHGLAFEDRHGQAGLGPLTWIEIGERDRPRSRTRTVWRHEQWTTGDPQGRTVPK